MAGRAPLFNPKELTNKVTQLRNAASRWRGHDKLNLRLYFGPTGGNPKTDAKRPARDVLSFNDASAAGGFSLYRMAVDTGLAMTVRVPAVKVVPVGQQFTRQRAARLLGRFTNGVFYANNFGERCYRLALDGMNCRLGAIKWYVDKRDWRIKSDWVNPLTLLWDDNEGPDPRNLWQEHSVPKKVLAARHPALAAKIMALGGWSQPSVAGVDIGGRDSKDTVRVVEHWRTTDGDDVGSYECIAGEELVLTQEPFPYEKHTIVGYRWSHSFSSFAGRPAGDILRPYQLWANKITGIIAEAQKGCVPVQLMHDLAEVEGFSDYPFRRMKWKGQHEPKIVAPQVLNAEIYNWLREIKLNCFEEMGVNTQISQGTRPQGLNSAPSQREFLDIANARLLHPSKALENTARDSARVVVMLAEVAYKRRKARVAAPGTRLQEEIRWEDIGPLKEQEYSLEVQSVAALPLTVPGRLDFVKELMSEQLINPNDGRRMLQMPDIEAVLDRENAATELAERQVEAALWEGKWMGPIEYQGEGGLRQLIDIGQKEYLRAELNGTFPDDHMELCRRLIDEAQLLLPAAPPAPALPAATPGAAAPAPAAAVQPAAAVA